MATVLSPPPPIPPHLSSYSPPSLPLHILLLLSIYPSRENKTTNDDFLPSILIDSPGRRRRRRHRGTMTMCGKKITPLGFVERKRATIARKQNKPTNERTNERNQRMKRTNERCSMQRAS